MLKYYPKEYESLEENRNQVEEVADVSLTHMDME
jgi:hypothetical protein